MSSCFAYHRDGHRCTLDYEHDDNHAYTVEWLSKDNWTPALAAEQKILANPPILPFIHEEPALASPPRCFICKHSHASGECKCGCLTSIPE